MASGWNDDKGSPMGVVSPDGGDSGGGGGGGGNRVVMAVMTVALLFSVIVAAYSLIMLNNSRTAVNTVHEEKLAQQGEELKKARLDLAKAKTTDDYYANYALALEKENRYMETTRTTLYEPPPEAPPPQKYIDYLRDENKRLRKRAPKAFTSTAPARPKTWPEPPTQ
jgi:uncharacterized membrane protein